MSIQVGLVGFGLSGSVFHAPILTRVSGLELAAVVSTQKEKVLREYPQATVLSDYQQLLEQEEIALVVITTPNLTHYEYAKRAILAKKHVVVEKPFTITVQQADELIALAREHNVLLSVYQNRRWDNDFLTVKSLLQSGLLGEMVTYEAHFDRYRPQVQERWREDDLPGSGTLYDLGSHLIDQALVLFGTPQSVWADLQKQRAGAKAVDYFHLVLDYGSLRVLLHSGFLVREPGPRFQLHGKLGSFHKYGLDPQESDLRQGKKPGDPGWGEDAPEQYGHLTVGVGELAISGRIQTLTGRYEAYYEGLAAAIASGAPLPVSAVEARNVIRVIECALQSHREQRVVPFA